MDAYGEVDTRVWLEYASFERRLLRGPGSVYWRALKALAEPEGFVQAYQALLGAGAGGAAGGKK